MSRLSHSEIHMVHRIGWLRAAVLGANDGLVSTASLVVGVAAAGSGKPEVLIAGLAGLVAGAMSMAAGEYVSVSSQTDAENADLARETRELAETPEAELEELTQIYVERGLDRDLAEKVGSTAPTAKVSADTKAAWIGRAVTDARIVFLVAVSTILGLAVLGGLGASAGGAGVIRGAARVTLWGALAMAATAGVGTLFGVAVG